MQPLRDLIQGLLPENGENITVDTLLSFAGWTISSIPFDLPQHLLQCIGDTLAHTNLSKDDIMYWNKTPNGKFTTSSVYKSVAEVEPNSPFHFPWIWKLHAPNKIQTFM
ncbi:hypothetical protein FXO38_26413 [Capsicum annuum]|nr:hypothetical protein FXO38_26413 [Capsicum annuum]